MATEDRSDDVIETYQVEIVESDDDDNEELDPIVRALKKERLARNWTQWDVARRLGFTSPARVSQLEKGEADILLTTARNWAEVLGMEIQVRSSKYHRGLPRTNFR